MNTLIAYYRFETLSEELKAANKIKSPNRFDCMAHLIPDTYNPLAVYGNKQGILYCYQVEPQNMIDANKKRMAACALSNGETEYEQFVF